VSYVPKSWSVSSAITDKVDPLFIPAEVGNDIAATMNPQWTAPA
jgi:hypothetical protein